ncbi:hypothetical protein [Rhodococcus opacus]|uniref:hypothetical protein n=1 Tax=Rhodococcus opacus TaxID=37919 RepID=UPI000B0F66F4|nr:hypothetical protein [Rhodococcus opacus]
MTDIPRNAPHDNEVLVLGAGSGGAIAGGLIVTLALSALTVLSSLPTRTWRHHAPPVMPPCSATAPAGPGWVGDR